MKFRQFLLTSSAAVAMSAAVATQAVAGPFYVSVLGGANWMQDQSLSRTGSTGHYEIDTGFMVGGAIGVHLDAWLRGLRTEVEAAYRRNEFDGHYTTFSGFATGALQGNVSNFSILANVWYDIDVGSKVVPYLGGGVGWARVRFDSNVFTPGGSPLGSFLIEDSGFTYQLGVGLNYEVMRGVDVGVGYRYVVGPHIDASSSGDKLNDNNHSVLLNLTVEID
jgi:opacity protein-like surface antigen